MTARETLYRAGVRRVALLWLIGLVGLATLFVADPWLRANEMLFVAAILLALAMMFAGGLGQLWRVVRCPRCAVGLEGRHAWRLRRGDAALRVNFCPHCGLDFDLAVPERT